MNQARDARLSLVTRAVDDVAAPRDFYVELLGWTPVADVPGQVLAVQPRETQLLVMVARPLHRTALGLTAGPLTLADVGRITEALVALPRRRLARRRGVALVAAAMSVLVTLAGVTLLGAREETSAATPSTRPSPTQTPAPAPAPAPTQAAPPPAPTLPDGGTRLLGDGRMLVGYYGSPLSPGLGVLGDGDPREVARRLDRTAAKYAALGHDVQPVMDLVVTIAHNRPGRSGTYNSSVPRADVERFIRVAREHRMLLLLDLQPGRESFSKVVRRWRWALADPWVGLALDPEWRMHGREVPGSVVGRVSAGEVNEVSAWLDRLTADLGLPPKLLVVHQFRDGMAGNLDAVARRRNVVLLQHLDGVGSPQAKIGALHHLARTDRFPIGFKVFYRHDTRVMTPAEVSRIRPKVSLVTYQ